MLEKYYDNYFINLYTIVDTIVIQQIKTVINENITVNWMIRFENFSCEIHSLLDQKTSFLKFSFYDT